ncbi:MAG: rhodanese-like domain-containing protein [Planctomycetota bacterium]
MSRERNAQAAAVALMGILVVLAVLFGRSGPGVWEAPPGSPAGPSGGLARPIAISPEALAAMLRRGEDLVLIDLREPEAYAAFRIPGSANLSPAEAVSEAGEALLGPSRDREIVLAADDMVDAFEVAADLIRRGRAHVHVLEGGIERFRAEILTPPSLRGILSEDRAKELFPVYASMRRYFLEGGHAAKGLARDPEAIAEPTLVSSAWLARNLERVVPVDVRSAGEFALGHVPGAANLPVARLRETRDGVPDLLLEAERLAKDIGGIGIGPEDAVVVYGAEIRDATVGAMAFLRVGQQKLAVLEASFADWVAEGRAVSKAGPARAPKEYPTKPDLDDFTVSTAEVLEAVQSRSAVIVDARTPADYRGEASAFAGRAGRIPGAVSRNFSLDLVGGPSGTRFRPAEDLTPEYAKLGASPERDAIIYCQTGHRSSQTYYLLRYVLAYPKVRWYDGSWKAWASAKDLPIEIGPSPPEGFPVAGPRPP